MNCKKCHRTLKGETSQKIGICAICDKKLVPSWSECMNKPPSHYIGATKRYTIGQRCNRRQQWLIERFHKRYAKRSHC